MKSATVAGEKGRTVEEPGKTSLMKLKKSCHALLYVGIEDGWRLDFRRCETTSASSEAEDEEGCLWETDPWTLVPFVGIFESASEIKSLLRCCKYQAHA